STDPYRNHSYCPSADVSFVSGWDRWTSHGRSFLPRNFRRWMVTPQALDQTIVMKRVFLTGASSGIGRAIAQALLARCDGVWGTSRNLERIPKMPRWHAVRLDLSDPLSVEAAFNSALAEASYFDVVINNAGAGHFDAAEFLPMETIASQFQILVFGQIQLTQLALRHMQARGEGLVINVTSLASRLPFPFMPPYTTPQPPL